MLMVYTHKGRKKGDKVSSTTGPSILTTGQTLQKEALYTGETGGGQTCDGDTQLTRDLATTTMMENSVDHM